ncbi:MAG: hypothetical protein VKK62_11130 [Synechococcaceae cyanobacterium]|nr:hypothetical protein [Synechococcaceae cyanobacterium]
MSATEPEQALRRLRPHAVRWPAVCLALLTALPLLGCVEEPLPERQLHANDCLLEFKLPRLRQALKRCDRVVQAFPRDPAPLNDRFLLHSLAGDNASACRDIRQAEALARKLPAAQLDPLLRKDMQHRLESCRD